MAARLAHTHTHARTHACTHTPMHTHAHTHVSGPTGSRKGAEEKQGQPESHSCAGSVLELILSCSSGNTNPSPPPTDSVAVLPPA